MLTPKPPRELVRKFGIADNEYHRAIAAGGDTHAHLPTLRALCESFDDGREYLCVGEFGVRGVVTTWAFLAARAGSLWCVDIVPPPQPRLVLAEAAAEAEGIDFQFTLGSTLEVPTRPLDILFIDTLHTAAQLRAELERWADHVRGYIAFHDTVSFAFRGEDGSEPGLQDVVEDLIAGNVNGVRSGWELYVHDEACNGLTIVERYK